MSLTLDLDLSLEKKLKAAASQKGTSPHAFAIGTLKDRLVDAAEQKSLKRVSIANLLKQINEGISEEEWMRYSRLIAKRRRETITRKELTELRAISDQIELKNTRRLELVAELARRRGTDLEIELKKLGIGPRHD